MSKEDVWTLNWQCDQCGRKGQLENPDPPFPRPKVKRKSQMDAAELRETLRQEAQEINLEMFGAYGRKRRFY